MDILDVCEGEVRVESFWQTLARFYLKGLTCLMSSHDQRFELLRKIGDRWPGLCLSRGPD